MVSRCRVTVGPSATLPAGTSTGWEEVARLFRDPVAPEVVEPFQFVFDSPQIRASPELADYGRESFGPATPLLVGAADLMRRLHADFKYDPRATTVAEKKKRKSE